MNSYPKMKLENKARSQWILIGIGLLSFLTMITYLIDILSSNGNAYVGNLVVNVLGTFPFVIGVAYIDYQLVKYIYRTRWLCENFRIRILFEFLALSVLAVVFLLIGSLPFKYNSSLLEYMHSLLYVKAIMPAILMNVFTITIIEFFVQNKQSKERELEFERLQTDHFQASHSSSFL